MNIERVTLAEVKAACKAHIYDNCEGCPFQRGRFSCVVADRAAPLGWELGEDDGEGRREKG